MALPTTEPNSWMSSLDLPSRLFETSGNDYELYEEDDEFVLGIELPGFDPAEITVTWDEGVLNIAAEHEEEARGKRKTYHRRFRFPKEVSEDEISASYTNGILEVHLPQVTGATVTGTEIPIES
ncbi:molecular chaperone Hsp20 [Halodesulfurarchaeum formicicum]|uniref:Molecular chaperone Hsp20 n=1 Tax=Halodesulfurarchaeum formicicum TaxID=1873524 RepID=A0A1D8S2U8_9EURY|nr:Hsp20/alpha crystallin family protein [Halodesulfurarchaeum formicicum]AOW79663.1 molecular chaperone Hsp20 [Halodesulfurarchaeum formicicum]